MLTPILGATANHIPYGADLDDITKCGLHNCDYETANSLSNCPAYMAFVMEVYIGYGSHVVTQRIVDYKGNMFVRCKQDGGVWCDWQSITENMPSFYKSYSNLGSLANALGVNGYRTPLDAEHFAQVEISAIESSFQGKNNHEYWLFDFGADNYEGVALCYRHSGTVGEAVWITSDGLRVIKRNNVSDDGTWFGWYVYRF